MADGLFVRRPSPVRRAGFFEGRELDLISARRRLAHCPRQSELEPVRFFLPSRAPAQWSVTMIDGPSRESPGADELPEDPDFRAAMGRFLQWFIEGQTTAGIGLRVLVATHKLRPDLIGGISFQDIAAQAGYGWSAAHNLSEDSEKSFPVGKMPMDRSKAARRAYRCSHRRNGQGPAG